MTNITVSVKVVSEVVPSGHIDVDKIDTWGKITSCYTCGGILMYERTTLVEGTEHATDTDVFCAQCGSMIHGMFNDPFDELDENFEPKKKAKKIKKGTALIKMLKTLDNGIRLAIVEHILNSTPVSRTDIHKFVEGIRGKTSKKFISYHLDILIQGGVAEKTPDDEYHITLKTIRTLESLGLIKAEE